MRALHSSRSVLLAFLAFPVLMACSSATPPPQASVDVAPVKSGEVAAPAAPGGNANAATGQESTHFATATPPAPTGAVHGGGGADQDADGIADTSDRCPDIPEDRDGFEDADGCPDPDNDKDGIADMNDKCPNQPETMNGKQDDDGCPD